MSSYGRELKCLALTRRYPSFTHKGRKWVTGEGSKPSVPCPSCCSVLSFLSDLNFTILPFLYQNDVFLFLLLPDPLLHSSTPYISFVKYRDCHVSWLLIYWILLSLSERSPWASISSCSGSKSARSSNLKTLFSTL